MTFWGSRTEWSENQACMACPKHAFVLSMCEHFTNNVISRFQGESVRFWKEIKCEHERAQACAVVWDTSTSYKNTGSLNQNMCKRRKSHDESEVLCGKMELVGDKKKHCPNCKLKEGEMPQEVLIDDYSRRFQLWTMGSQLVLAGEGPSEWLWGKLKARHQGFLLKGASWCPQGSSAHLLLWNEINLGVCPRKASVLEGKRQNSICRLSEHLGRKSRTYQTFL